MVTSKLFRQLLITTWAFITLAITLAAQSSREKGGHPNFSGTWQLNRQLSDDPQAKVKEAMGPLGGVAGAIGRAGGKGRKQRGGGKPEDRMKNNLLMAESLKIVHTDPEFRVAADGENGVSKTFFTDGRPVRNSTERRGKEVEEETTARWQGEQLVVVTQMGQGGKRSLTYKLAEGGRQMVVSAQVTNPKLDRPIQIRLVYDARNN
ncbi:MAG: hypothetical protein J2P41_06815 [Blastocatellia bacterium]|nr:hypothetical protein [Blastocatellia bacterium]